MHRGQLHLGCRAARPGWRYSPFLRADCGAAGVFEQLYNSAFRKRRGHLVCTYFDENFLNMVPAAHVEGLYSCLDYYQAVSDPFSQKLLAQYDTLYPGHAKFTGGFQQRRIHRDAC